MSMSTEVSGIKKPDEEWANHVKAWNACEAAKVDQSEELLDYFEKMGYNEGDDLDETKGAKVSLTWPKLHPCCAEFSEDSAEGYEVDLAKLAALGFTHIRFVNSY